MACEWSSLADRICALLAETVRKYLREGEGVINEKRYKRLRKWLGYALRAWLEICEQHKLDPDDVALGDVLRHKKGGPNE